MNSKEPLAAAMARLARQVRSFREAAGLSQQELADRAGMSKSVLARLERGVTFPTFATISAIAAALDVDLNLELRGKPGPADSPRPGGGPGIKILIADSQRLFAEGLAHALAKNADFDVHFVRSDTPLTTGLEAAEAVAHNKPDVALLDYWLADMEGPALIRTVLGWAPEVKILILSWFHGQRDVQAALEAGAIGFLPKSLSVDEVSEAVRRARAGQALVYGKELHDLVDTITQKDEKARVVWERMDTLTPREIDVLRMLATGQSMKDVAAAMAISQGTLRIHLNHIMSKTEASSRLEVVAMARQVGLIQ